MTRWIGSLSGLTCAVIVGLGAYVLWFDGTKGYADIKFWKCEPKLCPACAIDDGETGPCVPPIVVYNGCNSTSTMAECLLTPLSFNCAGQLHGGTCDNLGNPMGVVCSISRPRCSSP